MGGGGEWGVEEFLLRRDSTVPDEEFVKIMKKIDGHLERCRGARGVATVGTCPDDDSGVRGRLERYYSKYAPSHLPSVDVVLNYYSGRENELFTRLEGEYGPEPSLKETIIIPLHKKDDSHGLRIRDRFGFLVENYKAYVKVKELLFNTPQRDAQFDKIKAVSIDFEKQLSSGDKNIIYRWGLPDCVRRKAWVGMTSAGAFQRRHPEEYAEALAGSLSSYTDSTMAIVKDMDRTFPNCTAFETGSVLYSSLHRVLSAVSHTTEVGYCQSMNFVAGVLLLVLKDEEMSYWVLKMIVSSPRYNAGYYDKDMRTLLIDQIVMKKLLDSGEEEVDIGISLEDFTIRWFLCIFIDVLPLESVLHLWDVYFSEGVPFLLRFSLVVARALTSRIPEGSDITTSLATIDDFLGTLTVLSPLIEEAQAVQLNAKQLEGLREVCQPPSYMSSGEEGGVSPAASAASPSTRLKKKMTNIFKRNKKDKKAKKEKV